MFRNISLAFVILILGGVGYYFNLKKFPINNINSSLVKNPVSISYDRRGVPFIKASNWSDAQFALGYSMARDRLWQMEILRRASAGRLSEYFGSKTLKVDKLMRTLRLRSSMETYLLKNSIVV